MNTRNAISIRINQFPSIFFLVFFCKLKVSDGIQEGDVCFKWDGNCCSKKVNIRIRNCSSFFVYKLNNKISCQYAYCGNGQWLGEVFSNETGSELTHCISQSFLTLLSAQHTADIKITYSFITFYQGFKFVTTLCVINFASQSDNTFPWPCIYHFRICFYHLPLHSLLYPEGQSQSPVTFFNHLCVLSVFPWSSTIHLPFLFSLPNYVLLFKSRCVFPCLSS